MKGGGNVLFNDALNTFYLQLYGVRHMVKDHFDSEKGNPLPPHRLLFLINSKGYFYAQSNRQDSTYHGLCYTSRGAPQRAGAPPKAGTTATFYGKGPKLVGRLGALSWVNTKLRCVGLFQFSSVHSEQAVIAHACHEHTLQLSTGLSV